MLLERLVERVTVPPRRPSYLPGATCLVWGVALTVMGKVGAELISRASGPGQRPPISEMLATHAFASRLEAVAIVGSFVLVLFGVVFVLRAAILRAPP